MITFEPRDEFSAAIARGRHDVGVWLCVRGERGQNAWFDSVGDNMSELARDPAVTLESLKSPDAAVRLAAVSLVGRYWPPSECYASQVLRLAFDDPEPGVRGAALESLTFLTRHHIDDPTGFLGNLLSGLFPNWADNAVADEMVAVNERRERAFGIIWNRWQHLAGAEAARMLESRQTAQSYVNHPEARLRRAALIALKLHWKPDQEYEGICETLLKDDRDPEVRSLALSCLAGCYVHTDDKRVGEMIARLVKDESNPRDVRLAAYQALFEIREMPVEAFRNAGPGKCRFPEDVDWTFVEAFLH